MSHEKESENENWRSTSKAPPRDISRGWGIQRERGEVKGEGIKRDCLRRSAVPYAGNRHGGVGGGERETKRGLTCHHSYEARGPTSSCGEESLFQNTGKE